MTIDAVITWVDGEDPAHRARRAAHGDAAAHPDAAAATRFASSGELRFAVLSLLRFCPFVRRIHVVTDSQHPVPLDPVLADPARAARIRVVDHAEAFGAHADLLPVFSSRSIETMIHRIPDLAERFLYLNDDIFVGRPMSEADYFDGDRPVLRGHLRRFPNPWLARLKRVVRGERPGYAAAQRAAARRVGRRDTYLLAEHQPHPMRRSTLAEFFADDAQGLRAQAGHRFRSVAQVSPMGLASHLELAAGARVTPPLDIGYVRPGRPAGAALDAVLARFLDGAYASFCVQSLDAMSDRDRSAILAALEARYV
ncbi:stealth family protein [Jannaschia sp. S6380]|uniref:Stealth CR1 domain-containing protein n=1 Tax=Jannaschia sp. S6380 TaxID=2926408 RepID=UPI001FF1D3B5|nr:Stealth CR1 domain-containing protein [Jannaschia sp. S6380]MCK0168574.1 stealth family protein [Jannaschia sp. S6380]